MNEVVKHEGVPLFFLLDKIIALWKGLQDKVDPAVHEDLLNRLRGNHVDAKVFRAALDLYFDSKLGTLTDQRIDEVLASFHGLSGVVVPDPVGPPPTTRRPSVRSEIAVAIIFPAR